MKERVPDEEYEKMTAEEKEEYDRRIEKMLNEQPMLQGLVQCQPTPQMLYGPPQTAYGPPNMFSDGGMRGFAGTDTFPPPQVGEKWLDDTRWRCSCGMENTSKFCPECGRAAPVKPWKCPECGAENEGRFCSGCGIPYKKENAE